MSLMIRPATDADIREFALWHYDPPYDLYDINMEAQAAVDYFIQDFVRCHVLVEDGCLLGYCTFGDDAQVPGGVYDEGWLDIGLGVKPEMTGIGQGGRFVEAVVEYASGRFEADGLRVTIAAGNERAIRVWRGAAFAEMSRFESEREVLGSQDWLILGAAVRRTVPDGQNAIAPS